MCDAVIQSQPEHANESMHDEDNHSSDATYDQSNMINHGSFGEVYKGICKGANVADKRIKMRRGRHPERLILQEADIHKKLANNIVKFIGTYMYIDVQYVYIITDFIQSNNMDDFIYQLIPVNSADRPSIARGGTEGVAYLQKSFSIVV